ncbi:hypothetical protein LXL04_009015 [Taraxacum kok-saghyz]
MDKHLYGTDLHQDTTFRTHEMYTDCQLDRHMQLVGMSNLTGEPTEPVSEPEPAPFGTDRAGWRLNIWWNFRPGDRWLLTQAPKTAFTPLQPPSQFQTLSRSLCHAALGKRRHVVDEKYTRPQGLYQHKDVNKKKLRKLILNSKVAPCYPGDDDCICDLKECPICFLACAIDFHGRTNDGSKK